MVFGSNGTVGGKTIKRARHHGRVELAKNSKVVSRHTAWLRQRGSTLFATKMNELDYVLARSSTEPKDLGQVLCSIARVSV